MRIHEGDSGALGQPERSGRGDERTAKLSTEGVGIAWAFRDACFRVPGG